MTRPGHFFILNLVYGMILTFRLVGWCLIQLDDKALVLLVNSASDAKLTPPTAADLTPEDASPYACQEQRSNFIGCFWVL